MVEDDEALIELLRHALELDGHCVLAATSGEQTFRIAKIHGRSMDVLVADVLLPDMSGIDLARVLWQQWPDLPVLFISGLPNEALPDAEVQSTAVFLRKPFSLSELRQQVELICKQHATRGSVGRSPE